MPKRLTAKSMSLPELLLSAAAFALPPSQRVYGWGEQQIEGLFRDIQADAFADGATARPAPAGNWFYFGTVYLAAEPVSGQTYIADGQQRIVTATMIFAAARDLATSEAERMAYHAYVAAPDGRYRLSLRDVDAAFFRKWVQEPGATLVPYEQEDGDGLDNASAPLSDSQNNILANRNLIVERLSALGPDGCRLLLDQLGHCSELIVITAESLDDATAAYVSTYKRGLSQATTDRLKAECLGDTETDRRARLANYWDECEALLGKEGLEDLLYLLTIERTRSATLTDLQREVLKQFDLPAEVGPFIEEKLVPAADVYRHLLHQGPTLDKHLNAGVLTRTVARGISDHLVVLMRTSHIEWRLPALVALQTLRLNLPLLANVLQRLERLAAAYMIAGNDPQAIVTKYAALADAIRTGDADAIIKASEIERPIIAKIKPALTGTTFATKPRLRMPVLLKINDLMSGRVAVFRPADLSCEHILPQNVYKENRDWHQAFRSPDGKRYVGATYRHRLGNVTILEHEYNRAAGSHPFARKRPLLNKSTFPIARDCAKYADWNAAVVDERTNRLAAMIIAHWQF